MAHYSLDFSELHTYDPGEPGITVPVLLRSGTVEVLVEAKLDTYEGKMYLSRF